MPQLLIQNRLLSGLPADAAASLLPHLEIAEVAAGQVLCEADRPCEHVHFPTTGLVSLQYVAPSGMSVEVGVIGSEGLVDVAAVLAGRATHRAIVLVAGEVIRLPTEVLGHAMAKVPALQGTVHRFARALLAQVAQTSACNRVHSIKQRLSRWLLQYSEGLGCDRVPATQELVGRLLGVRRESINYVASELHGAGLVDWSRGAVHIVDRGQLEAASCECYAFIQRQYA